jgi:D-alanyl-D-alanine dipeptidase
MDGRARAKDSRNSYPLGVPGWHPTAAALGAPGLGDARFDEVCGGPLNRDCMCRHGPRAVSYSASECVVKRDVGARLKAIQQELVARRQSLKMLDCYRPVRAVADMVAWSENGTETAERRFSPAFSKKDLFRLGYIATHSGHSTGAAVDLTLVDLAADNSATFDPHQNCADCTAPAQARALEERRHGNRL